MRIYLLLTLFLFTEQYITAQQITPSKDQIISLTSDWDGDRLPDGRPKVSDDLLNRLKNISIEEAWGTLRNKGYNNQYEGNWLVMNENEAMIGRALTVQYLPKRSDHHNKIMAKGKAEGRIGNYNSWPIDMLQPGDIYVADCFNKIVDGTLIGDNLGNAIYSKSGKGVIFYGSLRDDEGIGEIDGFNFWVKGIDPSYLQEVMLGGINIPIRLGRASVLPGDAVLAKKSGVIFIPAHLVEDVVLNAEFIGLRDKFGHMRLKDGTYTPGQIDSQWTEAIKKDFLKWLDKNEDQLPMSRKELDEYMKNRTW